MVYVMEIYTDGGCRNNGRSNAVGAAAAAVKNQYGRYVSSETQPLPSYPRPTNQRAELTGIILALGAALERFDVLDSPKPRMCLTVYTDSQYAVNYMTVWRGKWEHNGFTSVKGSEVANRDLIEQAHRLHDRLSVKGHATYTHISRGKNEYADELCNDAIQDQM